VRFPLRAVALLVALVTATAGLATSVTLSGPALAQQAAPAQAPVPLADPLAAAAPMSAATRADLMVQAAERAARQQAAARAAAAARANARLRAKVVLIARNQIGDRYSAGSTGPNAFDCSGLTRYVFQVAAGKSLPHQSRAQYARVRKIRFRDARPGDLVFFFRNGAHHVGVYIGNRHMVDAAGYGAGVRISPITGSWWSRSYTGMGRVLPA
jgi:cell wall-associated NlpC family hydrolase